MRCLDYIFLMIYNNPEIHWDIWYFSIIPAQISPSSLLADFLATAHSLLIKTKMAATCFQNVVAKGYQCQYSVSRWLHHFWRLIACAGIMKKYHFNFDCLYNLAGYTPPNTHTPTKPAIQLYLWSNTVRKMSCRPNVTVDKVSLSIKCHVDQVSLFWSTIKCLSIPSVFVDQVSL